MEIATVAAAYSDLVPGVHECFVDHIWQNIFPHFFDEDNGFSWGHQLPPCAGSLER